MAKDLKGTKTLKNLQEAYAGESQAMVKYAFFASVARKQGYQQIAEIFEETSKNEKEHAKLHYKNLGLLGKTLENLKICIEGEHYEHTEMYPRMAKEAREEGFEEIAKTFEGISGVEESHEARFKKLYENIKKGIVFKKDEEYIKVEGKDGKMYWKCRNCGYIHEGPEAPTVCPVCNHGQAFFEIFKETY